MPKPSLAAVAASPVHIRVRLSPDPADFILLALWLAGAAFYHQASEAGVFAPADLRVTTSPDLNHEMRRELDEMQGLGSLPGFYALTYSADVVLTCQRPWAAQVWTPSRRGFELSLPVRIVPLNSARADDTHRGNPELPGSLGALMFGAIITA
jgi:hypothetical protein